MLQVILHIAVKLTTLNQRNFHQISLLRNSWQLPITTNNVLKFDLIIRISVWAIYSKLFSHCFSIYVKWCSQSDFLIIPRTHHLVSLLHILISCPSPSHCVAFLLAFKTWLKCRLPSRWWKWIFLLWILIEPCSFWNHFPKILFVL